MNSSEMDLGGAVERVMGPSQGGSVGEGGAMAGRGVTEGTVGVQVWNDGTEWKSLEERQWDSQAPLMSGAASLAAPSSTLMPTAYTTVAGKTTGPTKSSPRKDAIVGAGCSGNNEDRMARTQHWIGRSLNC